MGRNWFLLHSAAAFFAYFLVLIALTAVSTAQTTWPGGTLTYTVKVTQTQAGPCITTTSAYTWTYTDTSGVQHTFVGSSSNHHYSQAPNSKQCPEIGHDYNSTLDEWSSDNQYYLHASANAGYLTMAGGFVNPKFVVMGVTYAPPGPSSFVNYSNSLLVGTETDIKNSFYSQYTNTVSIKAGGITGWGPSGSVTGTESTQYTQESDTSSSITVTQQTGRSDQTPGPASPYVGINHDADIIWVWLNPVVRLAFTGDSTQLIKGVQQLGYGYSTDDQPAMDVYPLYVGWLNGDIPMPANVQEVIARSWAAGQIWPSGQGPGLSGPGTVTNTDLYNILQADPYWDCGTPQPSSCPATVDGTRYTGPVSGENFIYQQACAGCGPGTQTYNETYTDTSVQGQGAKYTFQQTFGMEEVFGAKIFNVGVTTTLTQTAQFQWVHERDTKITSQTSSSAELSITGPPCIVVSGVCNPAYTGKTDFDVYQDNIYGTFLFFPIN